MSTSEERAWLFCSTDLDIRICFALWLMASQIQGLNASDTALCVESSLAHREIGREGARDGKCGEIG